MFLGQDDILELAPIEDSEAAVFNCIGSIDSSNAYKLKEILSSQTDSKSVILILETFSMKTFNNDWL